MIQMYPKNMYVIKDLVEDLEKFAETKHWYIEKFPEFTKNGKEELIARIFGNPIFFNPSGLDGIESEEDCVVIELYASLNNNINITIKAGLDYFETFEEGEQFHNPVLMKQLIREKEKMINEIKNIIEKYQ